jgi:hypothetical protein
MGGEYTDVRLSSAIEPPAGADAKKRPSAPARGAATITARLKSRPSADGLESEPCATFSSRGARPEAERSSALQFHQRPWNPNPEPLIPIPQPPTPRHQSRSPFQAKGHLMERGQHRTKRCSILNRQAPYGGLL